MERFESPTAKVDNKPVKRSGRGGEGSAANFMIAPKWLTNYRLSDTNCSRARARTLTCESPLYRCFIMTLNVLRAYGISLQYRLSRPARTKVQFTAAVYSVYRRGQFTLKRTARCHHTIVLLSERAYVEL